MAVLYTEPCVDMLQVCAHGAFPHAEHGAHRAIALALGHPEQHFRLACGQPKGL